MAKSDNAKWSALWDKALAAGLAAGKGASPTPMVVVERANPFDRTSPVTRGWEVPDGVCGFAWVVIRPGNSSFARWLVKRGLGRAGYGGGVHVWVDAHNQSLTRKEAHGSAMAEVFRDAGVHAHMHSRMD